jgi:YgiT-type zinc finger domain-containing protein
MICFKCSKKMTSERTTRYHYKESGLNTVYLIGVNVYKCECGHKLVSIPVIEKLHDAIAYDLLKKASLLTAKEFRFLRKWIGLTINDLAATLGVARITISRCENKGEMTTHSDHSLRMLAMRIKEEVCRRRMYQEIAIQELFEKMTKRPSKPARITIDVDNLPTRSMQ